MSKGWSEEDTRKATAFRNAVLEGLSDHTNVAVWWHANDDQASSMKRSEVSHYLDAIMGQGFYVAATISTKAPAQLLLNIWEYGDPDLALPAPDEKRIVWWGVSAGDKEKQDV